MGQPIPSYLDVVFEDFVFLLFEYSSFRFWFLFNLQLKTFHLVQSQESKSVSTPRVTVAQEQWPGLGGRVLAVLLRCAAELDDRSACSDRSCQEFASESYRHD